ncbi:hypothetical protein [Methanogenium organophilum]|uniref:Uncharacterized protein n=1 Tax=Methanogenium organophilum TaxID=2199 RepID=A0A9X9S455_METOG|nr:hypothetical protein [Methanogenium organophilum]WAI01443.1 hypothetical protein OU421_00805 [Methanogenium organophilum]
MKMKKGTWALSVLLAMLLVSMIIVPVSAAENTQVIGNNQDIVGLFEPINAEIESTMATIVTSDGFAKTDFNSKDFSEKLVTKYQKNLDQILDSLEKEIEQKLSVSEREDLKQIIVQEHMERVSWVEFKKKLGVKDEDFKPMLSSQGDTLTQSEKSQILSLPLSLVLVQVADDVYGGAGIDGAGIPYWVNGENDLFFVSFNDGYDGKTLYQCHFRDEDVPDHPINDAAYDEFRMLVYGTLVDIQGFFIYDPDPLGYRDIEFGNDYDNGCSYGTVLGQHGARTYEGVYTTGIPIYISNVWNHAMGLDDRNSNMAKKTYYYY